MAFSSIILSCVTSREAISSISLTVRVNEGSGAKWPITPTAGFFLASNYAVLPRASDEARFALELLKIAERTMSKF